MGNGPGINGGFVLIENRVLLLLWVVGWCWIWYGGRHQLVPTRIWCHSQSLSNVDATALLAAAGMLVFSLAPSYTYVDQSPSPQENCAGLRDDRTEYYRCQLENFHALFGRPSGINAWHETTTALPVMLVLAVAALLLVRSMWAVPAWIVKVTTRVLLLIADLVFGWALFNPSLEVFQNTHYGWGLWASLACLVVISVLAISSPPRFLRWLVD